MSYYMECSPLGPTEEQKKRIDEIHRLEKLKKDLDGVDTGIVEVEKHIIDRMKAESGACNMKALAEALEITRKLERRNT